MQRCSWKKFCGFCLLQNKIIFTDNLTKDLGWHLNTRSFICSKNLFQSENVKNLQNIVGFPKKNLYSLFLFTSKVFKWTWVRIFHKWWRRKSGIISAYKWIVWSPIFDSSAILCTLNMTVVVGLYVPSWSSSICAF